MDQIHDIRNRFFEKGENISRIADELHLDSRPVIRSDNGPQFTSHVALVVNNK